MDFEDLYLIPDDYLDAFAEGVFDLIFSRYRQPSHAIAVKRGWSTLVGNSAHPIAAPRGGAPWTEVEERDLLVAAAGKINLTKLSRAHGRTEHAIACRLEQLGVNRDLIVASDFEPVPAITVKVNPNPMIPPKPRYTSSSPESRLRTLLTVAMGFSSPEHVKGLPPPDITFLVADDLIDFDPSGRTPPSLTPKGRQVVDNVVGRSTGRKAATVAWNQARETSELDDGRFYVVANGDVYKEGGPHGRPTLKNPPRVVQSRNDHAEAQAVKLAHENPGTPFFVLQAVSVHKVPAPVVPPAVSKRV
ncbi:hypothetical protein P9A54_gp15 [Xanthomonas phage vB_Xar_IVIA-DoCa10]|uniref:Uncharacterized protein n=1 Tax=Xanthomonas phage vB_Xar_IVIA-DoCa10 TaxID=2975529 RepID=A0A9X9JNB2_9CAUD|nr:hypothetical protein P9A54_gp15 [Xanthomonas phage vB_Xar_IVIA-DoCa10]UYA99000.1 hypothetical protein IVIADoCa10_15 [Xanthomonas phage vB_Xar_IVIA-DoCa10]